MNNFFLLHHLGMGDHIICNGLVREVIKKCNILFFPVKEHNLQNVKYMFSDLEDINFITVKDDYEMIKTFDKYKNLATPIKLGCFEKPNFILAGETFCEAFYRQAAIPFKDRWDKFYIPRNLEKEIAIKNTIQEKYIFVHDDFSRNLKIEDKFLNSYKIYRPQHKLGAISDFTLFDYRKLIEESEEIHCMDSSFAAMIDHMPEVKTKPKFIHRYIRNNSNNPLYKNNWKIINEK